MQDFEFFHSEELVKAPMCEALYLWARENPDYLYQQGMNDVLAVLMITLAADFCDPDQQGDHIFRQIHSPDYFWSEAYAMYAALMELGVNSIYYREDPNY